MGTNGSFFWVDAPAQLAHMEFETPGSHSQTVKFQFLFGDPDIAALYTLHDFKSRPNNIFTLQHVKDSLAEGNILPGSLRNHFWSLEFALEQSHLMEDAAIPLGESRHVYQDTTLYVELYIKSLKALSTVVEIYKSLPRATVALRIACQPLHKSKWIPFPDDVVLPRYRRNFVFDLNRAQIFACIVIFESGFLNLGPDSLKAVMAMSSGNSFYIATPLLSDPWTDYSGNQVSRIIGNVGRPGIAMLVPPQNPRSQSIDHNWKLINHDEFNGIREDCFPHTTLHLSFSGWEMAIDVGIHGTQDHEARFLEAPISIHDRGKWVADLDPLRTLLGSMVKRINAPQCSGNHSTDDGPLPFEMVSIDSWEELLEKPLEPGVVRACGNRQARLAATALSVQRGHEVRILPEEYCWKCCAQRGTIGTFTTRKLKRGKDVCACDHHEEARSERDSTEMEDDVQDEDDEDCESTEMEDDVQDEDDEDCESTEMEDDVQDEDDEDYESSETYEEAPRERYGPELETSQRLSNSTIVYIV